MGGDGRWASNCIHCASPATHYPSHHYALANEPLSALEKHSDCPFAGGGAGLYAAQLLRRGAGSPGVPAHAWAQGRHRADGPRRGHPQKGRHCARRRLSRPDQRQGALPRHRYPAQGQGPAADAARRRLRGGAESAVQQPALAERDRRAADVSRPRSSRRGAFPAAGRHEGGAAKETRFDGQRHAQHVAGQAHSLQRRGARRPEHRRALSRSRNPRQGAGARSRSSCPTSTSRREDEAGEFRINAVLKLEAKNLAEKFALEQNITTLRNRVNELGVAEPIIQQQGADRVVVQLPGVQDTAQGEGHSRTHRNARGAHGRGARRRSRREEL